MKESRLLAAACIFISTLCVSTNAAALLIDYTVGAHDATGLGNIGPSSGTTTDEIHLAVTTQSLNLIEGIEAQGLLNTGDWVVDFTGTGSNGTYTGFTAFRTFNLTVGSDTFNSNVSQDYSVSITNTADTISFIAGQTTTIDLGINGILDITPNAVSLATGKGTFPINIEGTFLLRDVPAVPIPAAVWLFGSGLLGLVGIARRNKAA